MSFSRRRFIETTAAASALLATPAIGSLARSTAEIQSDDSSLPTLFETFSERALKVLQLANQERQRMNHWYIGTEHLLVALFLESEATGADWLADTGVSYEDVGCVTHFVVGNGDYDVSAGRPIRSDNLQACLDDAVDLACDGGHALVQPEHLMLAIVESFGTTANLLMQEMWIERGQMRQVAMESLA